MGWLWTILGCMVAAIAQDDAASIGSALLVLRGSIDLVPAFLGCYLGTAVGDLLTIAVGATMGRRLLAWPWLRRKINEDRLARVSHRLTHKGDAVVFLSRFLAGLRTALHLLIGMLHLQWSRIVPLVLMAGVLHVGAIFTIASVAGESMERFVGEGGLQSTWPLLLVGIGVWVAVQVLGRWVARRSTPVELLVETEGNAAPLSSDNGPQARPRSSPDRVE